MIATTWTAARKMFYRARGYYAGTLNGRPFRLDPYHSKFWRKVSTGAWEPETFAVLDEHLDKDHDYLDIGAWIGPTVLYGASLARRTYCFEPDPVAFRYLAWNLELNAVQNVSAFSAALSQSVGIARMASFGGEAGDSMSSLLNDGAHGSDVVTLGWNDFAQAADLSRVSLVKMDIEGAEFDVLPQLLPWLKEHRPALYLSTHAPFLNAETRKQRMQDLADSLSFYGSCLEDNGAASGFQTLTEERALTKFPTFLFKD